MVQKAQYYVDQKKESKFSYKQENTLKSVEFLMLWNYF